MHKSKNYVLSWLVGATIAGLTVLAGAPAQAAFPDKPVNLVVSFPPGGATSALARIFAIVAEKHLGQRVIVQNLSGGGGLPGTIEFMKKPADGYWMIANTDPTYLVQILQGRTPYKANDFATLATFSIEPAALATPGSSKLDSVKKLIAYAKAHPKALTVGVGGATNHHAFALKEFVKSANIQDTRVVFQGGAPAMTALLGAQTKAMFGNRSGLYRNRKKVHILAIASPKRDPLLPNVPTFKELGYNVTEQMHRFLAVNKKVPKDRQEILQKAIDATLKDPEFAKRMSAAGGIVPHLTKEQTSQYIVQRIEQLKKLIK